MLAAVGVLGPLMRVHAAVPVAGILPVSVAVVVPGHRLISAPALASEVAAV